MGYDRISPSFVSSLVKYVLFRFKVEFRLFHLAEYRVQPQCGWVSTAEAHGDFRWWLHDTWERAFALIADLGCSIKDECIKISLIFSFLIC